MTVEFLVTFKVDYELLNALDALAVRLGKTRSEVIREAIKDYIAKHPEVLGRKKVVVKRYVLY